MNFSATYLGFKLVDPLRRFFAAYGGKDFSWNDDPKLSGIEIDTINNFHKVNIQAKPRVLISRGGFSIKGSGLTDSMSESRSYWETKGLRSEEYLVFIDGQIQILVEARQEGTCEVVADSVVHFLNWSSSFMCDYYGFKHFGNQISVSPCTPFKEDIEGFQCSIGIPWTREESWKISTDGIKIKDILLSLDKSD